MRMIVRGRAPLRGTLHPSGNSNAALATIAAALLTDAPVTLHNVPDTLSTAQMLENAQVLGASVTHEGATVRLHTPTLLTRAVERTQTEQQVGTVLFLAPLLARRQHARLEVTFPLSRLYTHLNALRDLGADVRATSDAVDFQLTPWEKREIVLAQTSVTATVLVSMLAASMGQQTTICNAASEPHVQDVLRLLVAMGAQVEGIGSNRLRIQRAETLVGASVQLAPDHVEIASIAGIVAITGGTLTVQGVVAAHLRQIARVYGRLGVHLYLDGDTLLVPAHDTLTVSQHAEELDVPIETAPWPGFPSDLIAMAALIATQARGMTLIHEKLFGNRLLFVDKLNSMGAQIVLCDPHRALIAGPTPLRGEYLDTPDVRTGLALLGAALCAEGDVTIDNAQLIERTFENTIGKLTQLGAQIEVVQP